MKVYILEEQVIDHCGYETFVDVFTSKEIAVESAVNKIVEQNEDEEEADIRQNITIVQPSPEHIIVSDKFFIYYVTEKEPRTTTL